MYSGAGYDDERLPFKHGFPLRLIVPGWYGMAHVKWLSRITYINQPFLGPWQVMDYVYVSDEDDYSTAIPTTEIKVNSIITWPFKEQRVKRGSHVIKGIAWSGSGTINRVQVSIDGGYNWRDALLTSPEHCPNTWTFWEYNWMPDTSGHYQIMVKAEDRNGK